uniref:Uncharacterized protein n=1 Tax=Cacopsylla melanoneura TaxID=428564 RepID=A0A8D8TQY3_9HEMI
MQVKSLCVMSVAPTCPPLDPKLFSSPALQVSPKMNCSLLKIHFHRLPSLLLSTPNMSLSNRVSTLPPTKKKFPITKPSSLNLILQPNDGISALCKINTGHWRLAVEYRLPEIRNHPMPSTIWSGKATALLPYAPTTANTSPPNGPVTSTPTLTRPMIRAATTSI